MDPSSVPPTSLPATGMFAALNDDIRAQLASAGRFENLPVGAYVATQGEPHHSMAFLLSGRMDVYVRRYADIVKVASIGPGETVGEMNMIDPHKSASADVVVGEPTFAFLIGESDFAALVEKDPVSGYEIMKVLAKELCQRLRHNSETLLKQVDQTRSHFREMDY